MNDSALSIHDVPMVYCVILNWNGWQDTIECLESVFRLDYARLTVIVCDNASTDSSMERIEDWAGGRITAICDNLDLAWLVLPPIPKPVAFDSLSTSRASSDSRHERLLLIQTGANLGFAGGSNVGIRYALGCVDCDYVWLLNNDTVVEPVTLSAMIEMAEADPRLGICGSQLRSYASPHKVLTMGGRKYSRWSGRTRPLQDLATPQISTMTGAPDYIEGASMLMSRRCLETTGLIDESYFLYYEELDFVRRMEQGFLFGYSKGSIVYHKEGASTGTARVRADRGILSEFYQARNRVVFTWRHHFLYLPFVLLMTCLSAIQRISIGRPQNARAILRGAWASLKSAGN